MRILGIETSCDETAAAVIDVTAGRCRILSSIVSSQVKIHRPYGGVVPELAARNHIIHIIPVIDQALKKAKTKLSAIDRLAVTAGPGLITALLVGVNTAKTIAAARRIPIVPVNHLLGHLYAPYLTEKKIAFPALALIVSGGHTELIFMSSNQRRKKIGQTLDDAAGEAFDKVAQLLGLPYPGGPAVARLAEQGNDDAYKFPRPMLNNPNFDFSFAGLKTAVLYTVKKLPAKSSKLKANVCASFQAAVVETLVAKTIRAAVQYRAKTIILSGGVAANKKLRADLAQAAKKQGTTLLVPPIEYCTDNAAMIAIAGYFLKPVPWQKIDADPGWEVR